MALVLEKKQYPLMPEGTHAVTITEVKDLGEQDTPFGKKRQLYIRFQNSTGDSVIKRYTASISDKSNLAKDVKAITGKPMGSSFDVESLVGTPLQIVVVHAQSAKGNTYANIAAFLKAQVGQRKVAPAAAAANLHGIEVSDNDLGF